MAALAWLLIPVGGAVSGALWARWASRTHSQAGDVHSLAGYERFREAMDRPPSEGERI